MTTFVYDAKDQSSQLIHGELEADNENMALRLLAEQGYFPLRVREHAGGARRRHWRLTLPRRRISARVIGSFTRELAELIGAGLPLLNALRLLGEQTTEPRWHRMIEGTVNQVRGGSNFADALRQHPRAFNPLYVNLVQAGELSGTLEEVLNRLADFAENQDELRTRVLMAFVYPAIVLVAMTAAVAYLLIAVIPKVIVLFEEMGQTLPLPTRIVMGMSDLMIRYGWTIPVVVAIGVLWLRRVMSTPNGRHRVDQLVQRIPVFGDLLRQAETARMAQSLSMLIGHGAPLLESISVVARGSTNEMMRRDLEAVQTAVAGGAALAQAMSQGTYLTPAVTNMVAVGEEGGALEQVLQKIATAHNKQVDRSTRLLTTLLEPILLLFVGAVVACIVVAMLLPIFEVGILSN